MKLCNEVITIFNARCTDGDDVYYPTTINGASWFETQAETVDPKGGLVMANKVTVRIPEDAKATQSETANNVTTIKPATYTDPISYKSAASVSGKWTLCGGTIIIKGEATGTSWTPASLKATFAGCMTVLGVTDNRRAPNAPHFKVVGA